ncbi:hypothetical protein OAF32_02160 [Akkermansiaceae bacterium]|nr:hypothetical protein [Akkermansiaceae bacterium]
MGIRLALLPYQNHLSGFPSLQIHGKGIGIMKSLQVLIALFVSTFLPLHAASLDDLTYEITNGKVTITDCDAAATGELVIPDIIDDQPPPSPMYSAKPGFHDLPAKCKFLAVIMNINGNSTSHVV